MRGSLSFTHLESSWLLLPQTKQIPRNTICCICHCIIPFALTSVVLSHPLHCCICYTFTSVVLLHSSHFVFELSVSIDSIPNSKWNHNIVTELTRLQWKIYKLQHYYCTFNNWAGKYIPLTVFHVPTKLCPPSDAWVDESKSRDCTISYERPKLNLTTSMYMYKYTTYSAPNWRQSYSAAWKLAWMPMVQFQE
jgi:hypothetical protein